jgi:protein-disulfide isomerase
MPSRLLLLALLIPCVASSASAQRGGSDAITDDAERVRVLLEPAMPARGPADALVTLVVFTDFQCPFCSRLEPTLEALIARYGRDLRVVHRDQPLPFHDHAEEAAEAAREAMAQRGPDGFFRMAAILFENQRALDRASLEGYAASLGLDLTRFRAALDGHVHLDAIDFDAAEGTRLGARGTPSTFINGRALVGAQPIEAFATIIDDELVRARAAIAARRATRATYYERLMRGAPRDPAPAAAPSSAPDPDRRYIIAAPVRAPSRGASSATLVVQIFSDFQCPFCARLMPTLDALVERYGTRVRFVWRNYPLPFHDHAMEAAEAAMEAFAQRGDAGFWAMHDLLFENQRDLDRASLERYATTLGLDMVRFRRALDTHLHQPAIMADMTAIRDAGASIGTPTLLIGTRMIAGAMPVETFAAAIDAALAAP